MGPGDKIFAVLLAMFVAGLGLGGWWLLLSVPFLLAILFVGFAMFAADRFLKGLRLW